MEYYQRIFTATFQSLTPCLETERPSTNRETLPRFSLSLPPSAPSLSLPLSLFPPPVRLPVFSPCRICPGCVISRDMFEDHVQRTPSSNYWPALVVAAKRINIYIYARPPESVACYQRLFNRLFTATVQSLTPCLEMERPSTNREISPASPPHPTRLQYFHLAGFALDV